MAKMMQYFRHMLATLCLLSSSFSVMADWYEATGQAKIRHGDVRSAKARATQDAVKQAMLFAGANVASIQNVSKGLMMDDYIQVQANGAVNQIEIVDEQQRGSTISVTIRADIFPLDRECYASDFGKKIAITQFPIQNWEEAKVGGLYQLEKAIPQHMVNMLQSGAHTIYPVAWFEKKLNVSRDFEQQGRVRYELIDAVANQANTQFVMFGRITDLSFGEQSNSLSFWQDDQFERFFSMEVIIANALTHEVMYQNQFSTEAEWTTSHRKTINVNSRKFWNGEYGHAIERLLTDVRDDVLANLNCQQMQSKILAVRDGQQIQINIGRGQGVHIGQEYRVSYRADVVDDRGNLLTNFVISPYRVKITQVYENSAIAESLDADFMSNVQVNDIIELKDWATSW